MSTITTFLPATEQETGTPCIVLALYDEPDQDYAIVVSLVTAQVRTIKAERIFIDFSCLPREQQDIVSAMRVRHQVSE